MGEAAMQEKSEPVLYAEQAETVFDLEKIKSLIPHRYPFLYIDKVIYFEDGKRIVAAKNVTANEPFFAGHFPERPVMPGVIILEAMAQAGCIMAKASTEGIDMDTLLFLAAADDVKWKRSVVPGDTLVLDVSLEKQRRKILKISGTAYVAGQVAATANITAAAAPSGS